MQANVQPLTVNLAIYREIKSETRNFMSALIAEHIHYRFVKNAKKPVWLKIDWIHEALPYISRAGLAKKLAKLVRDGHIIKKAGEGRHYHKVWYSPSPDMRLACTGKGYRHGGKKVYYNPTIATQDLHASVIYATILNLLKIQDDMPTTDPLSNAKTGAFYGRFENTLTLDYTKLVEGSGLVISHVRRAVRWLIAHKKIESRKTFGNKRVVWLPSDQVLNSAGFESRLLTELPTESNLHGIPQDELPAESYFHAE